MDDLRILAGILGRPAVHVSAETGSPSGVFIGVGPADAVDRYLAGVEVDEVTDVGFDPFELIVTRHPGSSRAAPPGEQDFWLTSASSPSADITWPLRAGDYRLVVMNADGSPDVVTRSRMQVEVPHLAVVSLSVLIGSAVFATGGVALLRSGVRRMSRGGADDGGPRTWPPTESSVRAPRRV